MRLWNPDFELTFSGWPAVIVGMALILQAIDGISWLILKLMGVPA